MAGSYLLFKFNDFLYGVEAAFVHEIVELPELQSMAEKPSYLAGFFDLHGEIVQVIDLGVCLGYPPVEQYSAEDLLVILKGSDYFFGFIVNRIVNVAFLSHILPLTPSSREEKQSSFFLSQVAKYEGQIAFLLNPFLLINKIEELSKSPAVQDHGREFKVKAKDRLTFSIRALQLREPIAEFKPEKEFLPLIIITLGQEVFGVDPQVIKEFLPLGEFTPILSVAEYLLGFVNFRGTILTLIDIWPILKRQKLKITSQTHVVVVEIAELTVGIIVDKVDDLLYLHPTDFQPIPIRMEGTAIGGFTTHTVFYEKDFLSVLDIAKILESIM